MTEKRNTDAETPEQAAASIADALDFLRAEADAAGLSEVGELIERAASGAKAAGSSDARPGQVSALLDACKAIVGLPPEYRKALIYKKVYRRSCEQIADDCSVSVATARERVMTGFKLMRNQRARRS